MCDRLGRLSKTENQGLTEIVGRSHVITFARSLFSWCVQAEIKKKKSLSVWDTKTSPFVLVQNDKAGDENKLLHQQEKQCDAC